MTPPPTPRKAGDRKSDHVQKSEKTNSRKGMSKEKYSGRADSSGGKSRYRAKQSRTNYAREKHELKKQRDFFTETRDRESAEKRLTNAANHPKKEDTRSYCEDEVDQEAAVMNRDRPPSKLMKALPRALTSASNTARYLIPSPSQDVLLNRASSARTKHDKMRRKRFRHTPTQTIPFASHNRPLDITSSSRRKDKHSKKRRKSRDQNTLPSTRAHHSISIFQDVDATTSYAESYHERNLDKLMKIHFSKPVPALNPLDHLLSLPSYQPDPSDPTLSSAYTFIGAMQAEQLNLYERSADLECRIKDIRKKLWKLDIRQHEEIERLRNTREACERLAMELMLEEGAFEDLYEHGRGRRGFELGEEVDRMKARVRVLVGGLQQRMVQFEGMAEDRGT